MSKVSVAFGGMVHGIPRAPTSSRTVAKKSVLRGKDSTTIKVTLGEWPSQ